MKNLLLDQKTTLAIHKQVTDMFEVCTDISQGLLIFFIFYLFYNADLLNICKRLNTCTSGLEFIDSINILACSTSTEENCRTFEKLYKKI